MHIKRDNTILNPKHESLVKAFLLFKYQHATKAQKDTYEKTTRAERIARTMRLEGDMVTADEVRKFLKQ